MSDFRADLHCHTTCSDGTTTPADLVHMAGRLGLKGLAITDHDTVAAYEQVLPLAKSQGLSIITGAEFSAVHRRSNVHILAYSFPVASPIIQALCQRHKYRREQRNRLILDLLAAQGMPLSPEDLPDAHLPVAAKHPIGRPHIALAMVKRGYVASIQEAFRDYIGEGKKCYAQGASFSVEETLASIHQAKGLAIIAHPHLLGSGALLQELLSLDFDGLEGYYARFSSAENDRWVQLGKNKNWIITGGSDFHGAIKPHLPLGCAWVGAETFGVLQHHFQQHSLPA